MDNYQESLTVSVTVTRLRTACQVETGKEAQRKPGPMMDGPKRLGSGRADVRKWGTAMGRVDPRERPSETQGERTGAGGERKRKRGAGAARLSSELPPMPPSSQPPLLSR